MLCTTAINTSNRIRTQTVAAVSLIQRSGYIHMCYYVITIAFCFCHKIHCNARFVTFVDATDDFSVLVKFCCSLLLLLETLWLSFIFLHCMSIVPYSNTMWPFTYAMLRHDICLQQWCCVWARKCKYCLLMCSCFRFHILPFVIIPVHIILCFQYSGVC